MSKHISQSNKTSLWISKNFKLTQKLSFSQIKQVLFWLDANDQLKLTIYKTDKRVYLTNSSYKQR